jgi:hypothetical protein
MQIAQATCLKILCIGLPIHLDCLLAAHLAATERLRKSASKTFAADASFQLGNDIHNKVSPVILLESVLDSVSNVARYYRHAAVDEKIAD